MPNDRPNIPALIAALREATVGSRELDKRIARTLGRYQDWSLALQGYAAVEVPAFTTSLDAALTLVPKGMWWEISGAAPCDGVATFRAYAGEYGGRQRTPALALCIAALTTRGAG